MYLLDTVGISERFRAQPNPSFIRWLNAAVAVDLFTSTVVIGELRKGIANAPASARSREVRRWLDQDFIPVARSRILPVTIEVAERWGDVCGASSSRGRTLPPIDALIAATAIVHNLTVVSRNVRHFERCGARVLNPWDA